MPQENNSTRVFTLQRCITFRKLPSLGLYIGKNLRVVKSPGLWMGKRGGKVRGAERRGTHLEGQWPLFSHLGLQQGLMGLGSAVKQAKLGGAAHHRPYPNPALTGDKIACSHTGGEFASPQNKYLASSPKYPLDNLNGEKALALLRLFSRFAPSKLRIVRFCQRLPLAAVPSEQAAKKHKPWTVRE
jgi:hypothetical protein